VTTIAKWQESIERNRTPNKFMYVKFKTCNSSFKKTGIKVQSGWIQTYGCKYHCNTEGYRHMDANITAVKTTSDPA